jgi:hypothetical protein
VRLTVAPAEFNWEPPVLSTAMSPHAFTSRLPFTLPSSSVAPSIWTDAP